MLEGVCFLNEFREICVYANSVRAEVRWMSGVSCLGPSVDACEVRLCSLCRSGWVSCVQAWVGASHERRGPREIFFTAYSCNSLLSPASQSPG